MKRLIEYAGNHGVKELYSVELADHFAMKQLADKIGMSGKCDPHEANQIIYSLTL